jgi:DNA-binding HxlR family transcriptional regulator
MARETAKTRRERRSDCPVAGTLDMLGDRWTLLIVRDLLRGKARYGDFLASPEGIPTNILAERLKRLQEADVVEAVAYSEHPPRYEYRLTPAGRELVPVVRSMVAWGLAHVPGTRVPADLKA